MVDSSKTNMRLSVAALAISAGAVTGACTEALDAIVFNPCSHAVDVRFWGGDVPPQNERDSRESYRVAAESVERLGSVLIEGEGDDYTAEVILPGNETVEITVSLDEDPAPVLITAEACAG